MSQIKPPTALLFLSFTILAISSTARSQDVYVNGDLIVSQEITSGGFNSYSGLFPGSITAHAATNQNLILRGSQSLGGGTTLQSLNDVASANQPLEFRASFAAFTVGGLNIGGVQNPGAGNLKVANNVSAQTLSLAPPLNFGGQALNITQTSSSGGASIPNWAFNDIQVTDSTHYSDASGYFGTALNIGHNFGGGETTGNRIGLTVQLNMIGPTQNPPGYFNHNYVAGFFGSYGSSDNGTQFSPEGSTVAINAVAVLKNGAQNMSQLVGMEIDIEALEGSSVRSKNGLIINYGGSDRVSATMADNMITLVSPPLIDAGGTIPGAKVGIEFGYGNGSGGGAPVRYNGTLIKTTGPSVVSTGIDFSSYVMYDYILRGKHSSLTEMSLNLGATSNGFAVIGAPDAASADVTILLRPKGNGTIVTEGISVANAGFRPPHISDSQAASDTIYFSTNSNKLVYKDSSGVVRALY